MHLISRALSPSEPLTFDIEYNGGTDGYKAGRTIFDRYQQEAHSGWITEGGALIFRDAHDGVIAIVGPTGYTQVGVLR